MTDTAQYVQYACRWHFLTSLVRSVAGAKREPSRRGTSHLLREDDVIRRTRRIFILSRELLRQFVVRRRLPPSRSAANIYLAASLRKSSAHRNIGIDPWRCPLVVTCACVSQHEQQRQKDDYRRGCRMKSSGVTTPVPTPSTCSSTVCFNVSGRVIYDWKY